MSANDICFLIGGPQGSGLDTSAYLLSVSLAREGYGVIADREYHSNIVGKHSYIHMRVSSKATPRSLFHPIQILGSLDSETIFTHFIDLSENGYLIYDSNRGGDRLSKLVAIDYKLKNRVEAILKEMGIADVLDSVVNFLQESKKTKIFPINFKNVLKKLRDRYGLSSMQISRYVSSIVVGGISAILNLDIESLNYSLERRFSGREKIIEQNRFIINEIYNLFDNLDLPSMKLPSPQKKLDKSMIINGNEIIAIAKIIAGVRYESYYPITPAADECMMIERFENIPVDKDSISIIVFQTEDEIAAISSAIGASLTGVRSSTATSGPGFSLMVEALSWAGMNGIPLVITYYQRAGPSTGMPTRGSQSDALFSVFASHGEFPRVILSSGDHLEAFYDTIEAFNIAEKYKLPVIHLLDKFLANSVSSIEIPDLDKVRIDRVLPNNHLIKSKGKDSVRQGLSRPILGSSNILWFTGNEHDEYGHISEESNNRIRMYEKRMRKLDLIDRELAIDLRVRDYNIEKADYILVGWGSVKGVCLDAIEALKEKRIRAGYIHIKMLYPFPKKYFSDIFKNIDVGRIIVVEHNYLSQLSLLISMETGIKLEKHILKYNGRPIYLNELIHGIKKVISEKNRVVLSYGA